MRVSTTSTDMTHVKRFQRRDIQGLRAVAVLAVVAFHAGVPLPGGFVGVDMFFVVSGFVITAMLQREWNATGRIRFGHFYLRRFKRLTPALAVVVGLTVLGSVLLLSPLGPQQTTATTGLGAMVLAANIVISRASGNYFDAPAGTNPLLHTWSLSVEEQFYLAFPLILMIGWTISRRWPRWRAATVALVGLVALVSFGLTLVAVGQPLSPRVQTMIGFYGPLSRAWEFAVGALLALAGGRIARSYQTCSALGALGLALVIASLFAISEFTPFPGPWTLLPVAGTVLLLAAGTGTTSPVTRVLSTRSMTKIGDWSYSIYLWHWPLIVFAKVLWPGNGAAVVLAAAVSFGPALASYRWVETPIRQLRELRRPAATRLVATVVGPVLVISLGVLVVSNHVLGPRFESGDERAAYAGELNWSDHDYRFGGYEPCTSTALRRMVERAPNYEPRCQQSKPGRDVDLALVGDSHAEHLFIGLSEALPHRNIMYFAANAAPSMSDPQYAAAVSYVVATPSINTVLVTADWSRRGVPQGALVGMLRTLRTSGKTVLTTDDVPNFAFSPFGCKYPTGLLVPTTCTERAAVFSAPHRSVVADLRSVLRKVPGVGFLRTAHYLCTDTECSMTHGRYILYADPNHLNVSGSRYVGRRMVADYPVLSTTAGPRLSSARRGGSTRSRRSWPGPPPAAGRAG